MPDKTKALRSKALRVSTVRIKQLSVSRAQRFMQIMPAGKDIESDLPSPTRRIPLWQSGRREDEEDKEDEEAMTERRKPTPSRRSG